MNSHGKQCEDCGQKIPEKRLKAKPNAIICTQCQEEREANGDFVYSSMEITQEINGWTYEGQQNKLIKGD